jgi:hypothetical protein
MPTILVLLSRPEYQNIPYFDCLISRRVKTASLASLLVVYQKWSGDAVLIGSASMVVKSN